MKLSELKEYYKALNLESPSSWDGEVGGLTSIDFPVREHAVFVKNNKFLSKTILKSKEHDPTIIKSMAVIIDKNFLESDRREILDKLDKFGVVISTDNVDHTMSFISGPFYQIKIGKFNDLVDGRQMGTAVVHPTAWIGQNVFIGEAVEVGENVIIHPGCVIMSGAKIESNTVILPNVTIYHLVRIGKNCRIHSGAVIGADGFGYNFYNGEHKKVWHMGSVIIGDSVEIGANTTIDAGTFSPTIIKSGAKIDNQVQIGHNNQVGYGAIICGQAGLAGSCNIGDFSVLAGKSSTSNNVSIGKGCQVAGMAGVSSDWPDGSILAGYPARPLKEWLRGIAYLRKVSLSKSKK